ncbi:NADPH-dependent FMN reductase [Streptomyces alkaliphilus]|uniref:NADPH-dependent FMN reductase n=1 Tax=Streptomyces alkaliphilus TaxID=1472722 RepID=A0A7W3THD0_9ACTN|nr:NAD(P)H-dependent oxidoreductase [Streptomyces alkaliphilus]MBB0246892.1 NADPH-dependent FMN reductase [Streptomyces alkaliphilus]
MAPAPLGAAPLTPELLTEPRTGSGRAAPLRLAVVIGSTRVGRRGSAIGRWFADLAAAREGLEVEVVDLAEHPLPAVLDPAAGSAPAVTALGARLDAADAFVIVTPEYNHSFPAPLKHAIDWYGDEWYAKPVAFVSYGGRGGGLRAVEQLRQVFAELHAVTVRETVSLHGPQEPGPGSESDPAATAMLDRLTWWADALRAARAHRPFTP